MNKFIVLMSVVALFASMYVFHRLDHMSGNITVTPYSAENVERVRSNIPKQPVPKRTPKPLNVQLTDYQLDQVMCMQTNIFFETRNQSEMGMIGTAWVTINRVNNKRFDNTVCEVVYAASLDHRGNPIRHKCQFAWYCDGMSDRPNLDNKLEREAWERSGRIAHLMVRSCMLGLGNECPPDPTHGGLFFRSGDTQLGKHEYYVQTAVIEDHTYFRISE